MGSILKKPWIMAVILVGLLVAAAGTAWLWNTYSHHLPAPAEVRPWINQTLQTVPVPLYFAAFAILPACGVPLTFFYLTAIAVLGGGNPVIGVSLGILAVALNMILTRLVSRGVLHPVIERMIRSRNLSIPRLQPQNEVKIVLALRLSPIPFALQNYVLALGHAGWKTYLGISLVIQGAIGTAVMLVGESVLTGGLGYILLALSAFIALHLILDRIRRRLNHGRS